MELPFTAVVTDNHYIFTKFQLRWCNHQFTKAQFSELTYLFENSWNVWKLGTVCQGSSPAGKIAFGNSVDKISDAYLAE